MFELKPFARKNDDLMMYDPFKDFFSPGFWNVQAPIGFKTDVKDNGDSYMLEADIPGVDKSNIDLHIENHRLIINAKRDEQKEEKDEKKGYVRKERVFGTFTRSFDLDGIDEGGIDAAYKDGVLTVTLPKLKEEEKPQHQIEIK